MKSSKWQKPKSVADRTAFIVVPKREAEGDWARDAAFGDFNAPLSEQGAAPAQGDTEATTNGVDNNR